MEGCSNLAELERQVEAKLAELKAETAAEYLTPVQTLSENMQIRIEVAKNLKDLKMQNLINEREAEKQAAQQNVANEKERVYDNMLNELEDRIRRLEEDPHSIKISDLWEESQNQNTCSSCSTQERRGQAVQVAGPFVVHMLKDSDISDDWMAIRKALQTEKAEKKKKVVKSERHPDATLFEEQRSYMFSKQHLLDEGECDRGRMEGCTDMAELERLLLERQQQLEAKLEEVKAGSTSEYLKPVQTLSENIQIRIQVARELIKDLQIQQMNI